MSNNNRRLVSSKPFGLFDIKMNGFWFIFCTQILLFVFAAVRVLFNWLRRIFYIWYMMPVMPVACCTIFQTWPMTVLMQFQYIIYHCEYRWYQNGMNGENKVNLKLKQVPSRWKHDKTMNPSHRRQLDWLNGIWLSNFAEIFTIYGEILICRQFGFECREFITMVDSHMCLKLNHPMNSHQLQCILLLMLNKIRPQKGICAHLFNNHMSLYRVYTKIRLNKNEFQRFQQSK